MLTPAQINDVLGRLDVLGNAVRDGNSRVQSAVSQIDALAAGSNEVANGAQQLADASPQLADGIATAASGSNTLAEGAAQASAGAAQLSNGLPELVSGLTTLHSGLESGIPEHSRNHRGPARPPGEEHREPGRRAERPPSPQAGTYGAGLAPFFVALAAWIGIYALFLIVKPVSRRAITALHSPLKITLAGWLTPGLLGALQMVAPVRDRHRRCSASTSTTRSAPMG